MTSATLDVLGLRTSFAAEVASTHVAHLPSLNNERFSLCPLAVAPGGPYLVIRST